jgi:monovalent cation:H+ antiporter, CPA1 family
MVNRVWRTRKSGIGLVLLLILLVVSACSTQLTPSSSPSLPENTHHQPGVIVQVEEVIIGMLFIAALVGLITQRFGIPYTIGLVIVGLGLAFLPQIQPLNISPELILALLVPPLVYEAAFLLNYSDLLRELRLVLTLAVPGVILTTLLVGGMVSLGANIGLPSAMVFGALIAATDPVAVVALFRSLGAPKRLQVLLEGESLLNDGTAIVLFNLMLGIALTGQVNIGRSVVEFLIISGGGIAVGVAAGILAAQLIGRVDNALVETALTTVLAYGSYLIAEYVFGVSGVLAVVAAGLASGEIGPRGMSATTRIVVLNFWEFAAFVANSFVFLIIGLTTDFDVLLQNVPAILWAILAVLVARVVTVYGLSLVRRNIPVRWKNILFWGGLRGAISLALALSLATDFPHRQQLQSMAFGVVLFTLVVQGLTLRPLLKHSGLVQVSANQLEYERRHARAIAMRAAEARLQRMYQQGVIASTTLNAIQPGLEQSIEHLTAEVQESLREEPSLAQQEMAKAWLESLRVQRNTVMNLYHDNIITDETTSHLIAEIDMLLMDPASTWPEIQAKILQEDEGTS